MADGSFQTGYGGAHEAIAWSVASGASNTGEIDLGDHGGFLGFHITTTAGSTIAAWTISASSTAGGTKGTIVTSTGGSVSLAVSYGAAIGVSSTHQPVLSAWRYIQLNTTAATTAAISGYVNVRRA